jgi:hypothetical protein
MVGLNVIAAETDKEAQLLATTLQQQFLNLMRGKDVPLQPPVDNIHEMASNYEIEGLQNSLGLSIVGSPKTVKEKLQNFIEESGADEIMAIARCMITKPAFVLMKFWQILQKGNNGKWLGGNSKPFFVTIKPIELFDPVKQKVLNMFDLRRRKLRFLQPIPKKVPRYEREKFQKS